MMLNDACLNCRYLFFESEAGVGIVENILESWNGQVISRSTPRRNDLRPEVLCWCGSKYKTSLTGIIP